jgi:nitrite reductase/ring-hydroxylating ferredoxin subunit
MILLASNRINIGATRQRSRGVIVTEWRDVAVSPDLPDRKPVRVVLDDSAVLLVKVDDQVFAIGNQCTHQGAGLDRGVVKIAGSVRTVTCPAHGSIFRLDDGKVMRPPATKPVPVYDVKVEDGRVFLRPRESD